MIGQTISHYEITEKIGEGGMGEVYRAQDTTLKREVAIKVLPEQFTQDTERLARFQREAQVLASLNHPNIAAIHSFEHSDGVHFLAMELVEGETLAQRVAKGPLAVEEALEVSRQIAEGLEAAHESGVIHRDLKPANVNITPEGKVKILDFGLAKALEAEVPAADIADSPTRTEQMTSTGVILGTAAYMSPEQARGKPVDKRTDVWSFGVVLYQCLTGVNPFLGESATDSIGAILHKDADLGLLPAETPLTVRYLLRGCLERDKSLRYRDIGDVRIELTRALSDPDSNLSVETTKRRIAPLPMVGIAVAIALVAASVTWLAKPAREAVPLPVVHAEIVLAEGDRLAHFLAISPDGQTLAFHAGPEPDGEPGFVKPREIMLRRLDQPRAMPIAGTQGWGRYPTFSPDGASIAYATRDGLYRVPATGGQPTKLCESRPPVGLPWGEDDTIIMGREALPGGIMVQAIGRHNGLQRVAASGGPVETITEVDADARELSHRLPHFLPGSHAVLFTVHRYAHFLTAPGAWSVWALRLETGERTLVVEHASDAYYANGQIVFVREGSLLAAPFDPDRLEMPGDPRIVLEGVQHWVHTPYTGLETGGGQFALSPTGTLAYVPGSVYPERKTTVVSVDRAGNETPIGIEPRQYHNLRGSADGRQLLLSVFYAPTSAVWIHDMERGVSRRQRADGYGIYAAWGPGPGRITYDRTSDDGERRLLSKPIGGSPADETEIAYPEGPTIWMGDWSPDGKHLVGIAVGDGSDLWTYGTGEGWKPITQTDNVREGWPAFSPDGRWLAYGSNESGGSFEVYVRPFPGAGPTVQVSRSGGLAPVWSRDGTELFFRGKDAEGQRWIMTAPVSTIGGRLDVGRPVRLFKNVYIFTGPVRNWEILADGKFVFSKRRDAEERREELRALQPDRIRIVQNWASQLKR